MILFYEKAKQEQQEKRTYSSMCRGGICALSIKGGKRRSLQDTCEVILAGEGAGGHSES